MDLPWKYNNKKTGGSHKSGATQKYNTIDTKILIADMPHLIKSIAKKNSVLFMWCTVPMMQDQMKVFDAIAEETGFKYKTMIFWNKTGKLGMGFWLRHQVEFMIMGVRGDVKAFRSSRRNIIEAPIGKHSQKPEDFRKLIEDITSSMGKTKKVELFGRTKAKGWKIWGDGVGL